LSSSFESVQSGALATATCRNCFARYKFRPFRGKLGLTIGARARGRGGGRMTQQAIDILTRWIAETVRRVPPGEIAKEAARLAAEFTAYAEDAGLNIEDLELEVGEDLLSYMRDALQAAADAESDGIPADEE
jgi:hypothetical protein